MLVSRTGLSAPNISGLRCPFDPADWVVRARYPSASEGWCCIRFRSQRGQAAVELAFQIPLMLLILAGAVQLARVFYTYHTLQKAMRGGAALLARATNVNYCDLASDAAIIGAKNFMVYGTLQPGVTPVVQTSTCDGSCLQNLIQILPERQDVNSTDVNPCPCGTNTADDCDV